MTQRELCDAYDVRGLLYFLMLAFGALRSCEPFHVYLGDVSFDFWNGTGAIVWLWHPSDGAVPWGDGRWQDRRSYLAAEFGLRPRNELKGHQRAGWKHLLLEETVPVHGQRSRIYWVTPEVGRLFWHVHQAYITHVRPRNAAHPYYFCSVWGQAYGLPWTLEAVHDTFNRAVRSIELMPGSARGLCLHAFRHRVAHWMKLRGISPAIRQVVLHHQSIKSQEVYGRPESSDVAEILLELANPTASWGTVDVAYGDLFPLPERSSRLDDIGRELACTFLGGKA